MNCLDNECKYYKLTFDENAHDVNLCTKNNKTIDFDYGFECCDFEELKFCDTCKYGYEVWYGWDDVVHRCRLQNDKLIHNQSSSVLQTEILPECNINKYEE